MSWIWILFFASFVLSWAIARFVRRRAISIYQKKHTDPQTQAVRILPDGAGLAIVATWFCSCAFLTVYKEFMPFELFLAMVPGLFLVVAILVDEVYHFPAYFRYIVHAAVVACALYCLGGVCSLNMGADLVWNTPVSNIVMNVLAFVVLTWLINVFRFFDGIDGKEGNMAAVAVALCIALCVVCPKHNPIFFLIPCLVGFLVNNWHPARYLMGDATASFLGYVFGVMAIYYQSSFVGPESSELSFYIFILVCLVPVFDVTYTLVRRLVAGDNVMVPTKNHLYQRLYYSGFSHSKVILTQVALCVVLAFMGAACVYAQTFQAALVFTLAAFILMGAYAVWVEHRYPYVPEKK